MAIEKHINFFAVEKASQKPGCPLCTIISEREHKYIDNTLFEHITNVGFRRLFRAAGGFCTFHSHGLLSFRDGITVAILCYDIVEDRVNCFEKQLPWKPKGKCPVCLERDKIENDYLDFLAQANGNSKEEQELRDFFTKSDGLCAPHYADLLQMKRKIPTWLKQFHEKKFKDLKTRLDTYIRLSAYGRQTEFAALSKKDQTVWSEAAANLIRNIE
jgi:hypothetical protein